MNTSTDRYMNPKDETGRVSPAPVHTPHVQIDTRTDAEESELVEGLRRGDQYCHEQLVRQYTGMMLAVARRLLRNEDDARDTVQEAFINVFQALPRFRQEAKLSTWLHRITVNTALMKLRAASRRPETSIDHLLPSFDHEGRRVEPIIASTVSLEAVVEQREIRTYVHTCIDRLPASYRTVLLLRDIEELTTVEVAHVLQISENAVKIRLHRARQALMTLLMAS